MGGVVVQTFTVVKVRDGCRDLEETIASWNAVRFNPITLLIASMTSSSSAIRSIVCVLSFMAASKHSSALNIRRFVLRVLTPLVT